MKTKYLYYYWTCGTHNGKLTNQYVNACIYKKYLLLGRNEDKNYSPIGPIRKVKIVVDELK